MKKFLVLVVALAITLAFVSGCIGKSGASKSDARAPAKQSEPKRQEPGSGSR